MKLHLIIFLLFIANSIFSQNKDLNIEVINVSNTEGKIFIGLFDKGDDFPKGVGSAKSVFVEIDSSTVNYTFKNIAAGTYAVAVYHDENDNGEMDFGLFHIPTEDYGCSKGATGTFGPPDFEDAKFNFPEESNIIVDLD